MELTTTTEALLRTLTPRTEKHGDDDVSAVSLGLRITGPNTLLDIVQPGLLDAFYVAPTPDGQEALPGVEMPKTLLRAKGIESIKLKACHNGWTFTVDRGIDENEPMVLGGSKIDKFVLTLHDGGTVDIDFMVGTNDIDADEAGWLFSQLKQPLFIRTSAPKKLDTVIDGTVGHPGLAAQRAAEEAGQGSLLEEEAGDAFARLSEDPGEGDPDGADDHQDDEGAAPDVKAKRRGRRAAAEVH